MDDWMILYIMNRVNINKNISFQYLQRISTMENTALSNDPVGN